MPKINLGLTPKDVQLGFPLAKPGTYPVVVKFEELTKSKKGDPMAVFSFTPSVPVPCTATDEAGNTAEVQSSGKALWKHYCVLNKEGIFQFRALQAATKCMAGWPEGSTELNPDEFPQFNGKTLRIETGLENDPKGRPQSRILRLMPS